MNTKDIERDIYTCASCGYCRFGCPVYQEVGFERVTVRGRMLLFKKLLEGKLDFDEFDPSVIDSIYMCAQCENCKEICPAGVDCMTIANSLREEIARRGLLPENATFVRDALLTNSNPFGQPREERGAWLPKKYAEPKQSENLFFVSCTASYSLNRVARSVLRILETADYDFTVLGDEENCCGSPLLRFGEVDRAREQIATNVEMFDRHGIKTIFTPCAGCFRTLSHEYPEEFRVMHTVQLFDELIREGRLEFGKSLEKKLIYYDGCDIGRHCGVYEEPRNVLRSIPGVELLEFDYNREEAVCCGGPLLSVDSDLARDIGANLVAEAKEKGADSIVTTCATCFLNFREGARVGEIQIDIEEITMLVAGLVKRKR